jgi:hypothetical protein
MNSQTPQPAGDPAEEALMEEFGRYVALISKNATEPLIEALKDQEVRLSATIQERITRNATEMTAALVEHEKRFTGELQHLNQWKASLTSLISRWMVVLLIAVIAEGAIIVRLLLR